MKDATEKQSAAGEVPLRDRDVWLQLRCQFVTARVRQCSRPVSWIPGTPPLRFCWQHQPRSAVPEETTK